nr:MAG TPA: hypothetical protein [Caudoviricetes sp.]DAS49116.1 MAG TPA: hypothetical protein [Caudoviricetes sp.]
MLSDKQVILLKGVLLILVTLGLNTLINYTQDVSLFFISYIEMPSLVSILTMLVKGVSYIVKGVVFFYSAIFMSGLMTQYDNLD